MNSEAGAHAAPATAPDSALDSGCTSGDSPWKAEVVQCQAVSILRLQEGKPKPALPTAAETFSVEG